MKTDCLKLNHILWFTVLLAACARPHLAGTDSWSGQTDIADFTATGRLAVKADEKGLYAPFSWTYQNQVQTISINTPLGNTVGQLCEDKQGALAVDARGRKYHADTAQALSRQLLGFALPVQYLYIWANGQRVKNAPYRLLPDGRLEQFGWVISRSISDNGTVRILLLENPKLSLRLVFDSVKEVKDTDTPAQCAARR